MQVLYAVQSYTQCRILYTVRSCIWGRVISAALAAWDTAPPLGWHGGFTSNQQPLRSSAPEILNSRSGRDPGPAEGKTKEDSPRTDAPIGMGQPRLVPQPRAGLFTFPAPGAHSKTISRRIHHTPAHWGRRIPGSGRHLNTIWYSAPYNCIAHGCGAELCRAELYTVAARA